MFKKLTAALLAATAVISFMPSPVRAEEANKVKVKLDGLPLTFADVDPQIEQGRTMVPFRAIAEALGVTVTWHQEDRSITAKGLDGTDVRMVIDQRLMSINGQPVELDVPPHIVNGRTLIPLRAFSSAFKAQVDWDQATWTVLIKSPVRKMRMMAFYAIASYAERSFVPAFSDVAYGWSTLTSDGRVDLVNGADYRWPMPAGETTGETLLEDARKAHTRRLLMVHATDKVQPSGTTDLKKIVLDDALISKVEGEVLRTVTEKGFDGVELDLESLGLNEKGDDLVRVQQGLVKLVAAVASDMRSLGKQTVVSVHPLNGWFFGYDYAALAQHADLLQVMAHEYVQDGKPEPADRVEEAIQLALKQVDRSKLLLGINYDVETPETLVQKVGLAKRYSLAGVSVWRLGLLKPDGMAALETTIQPEK